MTVNVVEDSPEVVTIALPPIVKQVEEPAADVEVFLSGDESGGADARYIIESAAAGAKVAAHAFVDFYFSLRGRYRVKYGVVEAAVEG